MAAVPEVAGTLAAAGNAGMRTSAP